MLIDRSKELLIAHGLPESEEGSPPDVIVPAFYNFPHAAKLLSLSFVLFAGTRRRCLPDRLLGACPRRNLQLVR